MALIEMQKSSPLLKTLPCLIVGLAFDFCKDNSNLDVSLRIIKKKHELFS